MVRRTGRVAISAILALALVSQMAPGAGPAIAAEGDDGSIGRTPPRLSYADGEVSYFRPGAQDWAPAEVNTALAPGDELYTGNRGNLELQIGGRAFVRAWGDSQLGLVNHEPDFIQIKVTSGHVSLDLRTIDAGRAVELDTPHAAFTIDRQGYYRIDVTETSTSFVTRRSGQATMTPAGGQAVAVAASEEVVLEGTPTPIVRSYVAPELDVWDKWNYARTDDLIDAVSSRYVSAGVYGVDDLDHYGDWRVVPTYGSVWVPQSVPADWAPYSTGRWVLDPFYGWTWVDTAPWGWAPYHYGRWVSVSGYWAWAPGPVIVRPVYAPALVAFFGGASVKVAIGVPGVSWVALSWGEPLVPWWGRPQFIGRPTWTGWGGPRVVNNVVVNRTTVVNVTNINVYKNTTVEHAVVAVREDHFGRGGNVQQARVAQVDARRLEPARTPIRIAPDASSYTPGTGRAPRPPEHTISRAVVATRAPRREAPRAAAGRAAAAPRGDGSRTAAGAPPPRIVPAPKPASTGSVPARPTFGTSEVERPRPQPRQFGAPGPPESRGSAQRPEGGAPRPESNAPRSEPSAPRPEAKAPRPEATGPRPDGGNAPRPEANAPRPAPTPSAPHDGGRDTGRDAGRGNQRPAAPPPQQAVRGAQPQAPGPQRLPGEPANRIAPERAGAHRPPAAGAPQGGGKGQPQPPGR
ncbi:MAG TPA: DUF6600 domain-containing protein [Methylomirabilota bacterium]|jgi:hypothetical protein